MMRVRKIMIEDVVTLSAEDTVKDAIKKFAKAHISGSPVLGANGDIIGILSETDILNALKTKCKRLQMVYPSLSMVSVTFVECFDDREVTDAFAEIAGTLVSEIMTPSPITIEADKDFGAAIDLMNTKSINRIPVVEGGNMVGIISRRDIIKGLAESD